MVAAGGGGAVEPAKALGETPGRSGAIGAGGAMGAMRIAIGHRETN
jgi:hypothetical protein